MFLPSRLFPFGTEDNVSGVSLDSCASLLRAKQPMKSATALRTSNLVISYVFLFSSIQFYTSLNSRIQKSNNLHETAE